MKKAKEVKIKFIADECVGDKTINFLRSLGYEIETVWDINLKGASNGKLIQRAVKDDKVFITEDLDFCNILLYPPRLHHGIIVLKISPKSEVEDAVHSILKDLLSELKSHQFDKTLIIVDKNRYRLRKE